MGEVRESLETSLSAAIDAALIDEDEHAALITASRIAADAIDAAEEPTASMLGTFLNYCKTLGIIPTMPQNQAPVVGQGRLATFRNRSRVA